ncbi:MAG: AMP-binding protein [Actinomycetales bacterium]|nr:AMP-binding protein [Actinomycetales bacterium]
MEPAVTGRGPSPDRPLLAAAVAGEARGTIEVAGRRTGAAELLTAASAVADRIAGAATVAVHATPTPETVAAVLGCLLAGAAAVPVPPDAGPVERAHVLRDSAATLLLDPGGGVALPGVPVVPVDLRARSSTSWPEQPAAGTALVVYTSGTTGPPKGAVLSRAALAADLDALAAAWAWTPDDTLVHGLPLFHVHGLVLGVLGALRVGSALRHTGRPDPAAYAAAARAGGTLFFGVPTVWSRLAAAPSTASALRGARLLVSGSAALPAQVFARVEELTGHRIVERYGTTETLITVSARADGERRPGQVGTPLDGVTTRLVATDGTGADVPRDGRSMGELWVRGATLFDGYLGPGGRVRPAVDPDGWYRTGDVAVIDPDGWHRIVGRASTDLLDCGGFRIGAGEVEDAVRAHPAVREVAVVGLPDPDLGQRPVAYVVADGVTEAELVAFVAGTLSVHKRPREVRFVDALPRNALGKVLKHELAAGTAGS